MYIIKHSDSSDDYSMVKPAYETGGSFYYADTGSLTIGDVSDVSVDYTGMAVAINSVSYAMTSLATNHITIPKLSFEPYEQFTLTSEVDDTLLIEPVYSTGISGYEPTTLSILAGNNTIQFKFRGRFLMTSQNRISGNYQVVIKDSSSPRGDYIELV